MNKKDDQPDKKSDPFSSSAQIFEDIFKEATQTVEKPEGEKSKQEPSKRASTPSPAQTKASAPPPPQRKPTVPPPAQGKATRPTGRRIAADTKPTLKAAQPRREEPQARPPGKPAKKNSTLKIVLLVVLAAVLAGALVNHLGVFDVSALSELLGLGKTEPVAPLLKKQIPKPLASSEPASKKPGGSAPLAKKEEGKEGASRLEVAKPTAPGPIPEPVTTEAPAPAQSLPAPPQQEPPRVEPAPVKTAQNPQTPAPTSRPSSSPPPQPIVQGKSSSLAGPEAPDSSSRYPYSIYLGSYQTQEMAKKTTEKYKEEGSPAYWTKVKLGDKGVWYRVYAGYFRNEAEAKDYVSRKQLKDAEVKVTRYAVLIGVFPNRAEAEARSSALIELGFPAYVIPEPQGKMRLYSGAFITKQGADVALSELASKGVRASTAER